MAFASGFRCLLNGSSTFSSVIYSRSLTLTTPEDLNSTFTTPGFPRLITDEKLRKAFEDYGEVLKGLFTKIRELIGMGGVGKKKRGRHLLDNCLDDMEFMAKNFDKVAIERLRMVASSDLVRISYTEAVAILEEPAKKRQFEKQSGMEHIHSSNSLVDLTEVKYRSPIIVYNYPKGIKAFNSDNKTVAAMDVLVPKMMY
ncbi:asparagine--tRNA ligase, cytoplasmic 1-like [Cornus florida]|uniref:asparagine--tRNA ligase, cytoplasmic 1-like n=1 Tax=Cornus florida TaxID=4283 RepID=UPI00289F746F|nr:asparagine--tRNA ligase, cytoplasmic 1-like [Cornus florida]